ncbi:MAG TPA: acyl transferase [Bacteroidia bacterium]|nr:acyl transferase [Bacteroidia bacterium]HRH06945.1 acyl transferase [Bacteroidia bacterium]HRH62683.1 acyl transferase [Bacteroidia bacterium]
MLDQLRKQIFSITNDASFEACAVSVFHYQYEHCEVYRHFVNALKVDPNKVNSSNEIPFLPISFFKTHPIVSGNARPEIVFSSSGTTGTTTSSHYVLETDLYKKSYQSTFELFYGKPEDYCIVALLPSYSERSGSSLIYMVDDLIKQSKHPLSGYYLSADNELRTTLEELSYKGQKTLLLGVSYALLDFAEKYTLQLENCIVMETGGMKGRRKEIIRKQLHDVLRNSFGVKHIHSEYGMTELLSQAYSKGEGIFRCPPWMLVEAREIDDPLSPVLTQKTGGLNVIDLANLNSCSFISTQDLGRVYSDNSFEVLGRFDNSDIRGCNLLL